MIGYYNYTVILTYLSLLTAGAGIIVSLSGPNGHPYAGILCLLICGLCDAFDGKVARTKKDRLEMECRYGIQIDSLSDIVAFGVLPACIGAAMLRSPVVSAYLADLTAVKYPVSLLLRGLLYAVLLWYMLAATIRLAYFNVTEEERQKTESGCRKFYTGVPVTTAALIFPLTMVLQYTFGVNLTPVYYTLALLMGFAFLSKIRIVKPGMRGILILVGIGAVEFLLVLILHIIHIARHG